MKERGKVFCIRQRMAVPGPGWHYDWIWRVTYQSIISWTKVKIRPQAPYYIIITSRMILHSLNEELTLSQLAKV